MWNSTATAKSLQLCLALCDPIDGSLQGSPVPGILQARTLEWVAISFSSAWKWKVKVKLLSRIWLLATPWTAAYQAFPSIGFSRQKYWSGVPLPSAMKWYYIYIFVGLFFYLILCFPDRDKLIYVTVVHFSSVQFSRSVMSDSLRPRESQHARPSCPSPTPRVHSNSRPLSWWCHPAISSSVVPFSSCPQSLPTSEPFPMSQLLAWGGQSTGVSALASFLPKNTQGWSPLEWTGWISLQSKGLSGVFSNTSVQKHQFFGAQLSSQSNSHIHMARVPLKREAQALNIVGSCLPLFPATAHSLTCLH